MTILRFCLFFITLFAFPAGLFADRWLILPPRLELQDGMVKALPPGEIARAMALYLKLSRLSQVVPVAEAEACLKTAGASMAQKLSPEILPVIAQNCRAERMLLTRMRGQKETIEVTTKVFYRESGQLTDTMVSTGNEVLPALGRHLSERFAKAPATIKESSTDLVVAGDTYGGSYYDWQYARDLLLGLDFFKSAFCLMDHRGKLQRAAPRTDRGEQKQFLEKLRFEGSGSFGESESMTQCVHNAALAGHGEGRKVLQLYLVSDFPRDAKSQIVLRSQFRRLARHGKILIAPAGTSSEASLRFWSNIARELSENASFLPSAQHVRVGLATGQEWHIFRRGGRIYESREAEPNRLDKGIAIPEKYAENTAPQDLISLYQTLSGNKVISSGAPDLYAANLKAALLAAFKSTEAANTAWRVLLDQNGQTFYVSLMPAEARLLQEGGFARVFTELRSPTDKDLLRNAPAPSLVIDNAGDSATIIELKVSDYLRSPEKYLRRSLAGRSFYILSGRVVRISPPEADALDGGF